MGATAHGSPTTHRTVVAVWWGMGFGGLTTLGLGLLTWGILITHALIYGTFDVISPEVGIPAPQVNRYLLAFVIGVIVNLASAPLLTWAAFRLRARAWPPVLLGLSGAFVAAVAGTCALLLTLGFNPVEVLLNP